jgi:DNA-directed RNA polymerase beta' subunit
MNNVKEIGSIEFGVFSPKEILQMSVCKIEITKLSGPGSVYDERMGGSMTTNIPCVTCGKNPKKCPGHFGHIELNKCVIHPLYYKQVVAFLKCICINCKRLLITQDQIDICDLNQFKGQYRFKKILAKIEKVDICCHDDCNHPKPKIKHSISDNSITMIYKEPSVSNKQTSSIILTVEEIRKILDSVQDEDVKLCGFEPSRIHPRNFILSVFPVLPPCSRPFVLADGIVCDDDLTNQLIEIVKTNNVLKDKEDETPSEKRENRKQKAYQSLKFRILTFYNNSHGKAKHPTNGRAIKGLKERISGKGGQMRNNLMGKRVEFSGRTVIGPDPTLKFGYMGMPIKISQELTTPERVTSFNKEKLTFLVNNGKANFIMTKNNAGEYSRVNLKYALCRKGTNLLYGDVVIRGKERMKVINDNITLQKGDKIERNGKILNRVKYPEKRHIELKNGDEVHRHLRDGDIVLLNRQPTLHKGSMLAKRIKIKPGKTFRMNLATTKTYNADFDGDEMNIHVPQSLEARAELEFLSATKWNIISAQGSKPNIAIVQDSLAAAYLMTKENKNITRGQFFDISMHGERNGKSLWTPEKVRTIRKVLKMKGKPLNVFNGKGLLSLLFPEDFIYEKKNNAHPDEPVVKIFRGVLYEGVFDKSILGSSHNSLIQVIHKEYGVDTAAEFISNIQFITNNWFLIRGFSVGLEDCLITSPNATKRINDKIEKCYIEADGVENTTHNPGIREIRITAALSKAKDVGMKIAKDSMSKKNNLLSTVRSGSKGDFFNISQLTGLLGQQNIRGARVAPSLNNGKRTLPHYPFGKLSTEIEYESRGFVRHSFIEGLNPQEFFFHAMSGREGICDTAMGTAKSGYIQRRIVKLCEDIQVRYDGTVRDANDNIYQIVYGNNGYDPASTVKVGNTQEPCDIARMVDRLNLQHEIKMENNK